MSVALKVNTDWVPDKNKYDEEFTECTVETRAFRGDEESTPNGLCYTKDTCFQTC